MIPHHAQALSMVDLTLGRDLDPEVASLAEDPHRPGPETVAMVDWLTGGASRSRRPDATTQTPKARAAWRWTATCPG